MGKYSEKQLIELSAGVFKSSPREEKFYASSAGTFYNEKQFAKLDDAMQKDCLPIKNPAFALQFLQQLPSLSQEQEEREAKEEQKRLKEEEAAQKKAEADAKKQKVAADAEAKKKEVADKKAAKAAEAGK